MKKKIMLNESIISVSEINNINKIWYLLLKSIQSDISSNNIKYYGFRTFCGCEFGVDIGGIGNINIKYIIYLLKIDDYEFYHSKLIGVDFVDHTGYFDWRDIKTLIVGFKCVYLKKV